jgi:hypothetical protein
MYLSTLINLLLPRLSPTSLPLDGLNHQALTLQPSHTSNACASPQPARTQLSS